MRFRPCIDLRDGRVVQIVGGSLRNSDAHSAVTNFATDRAPMAYAQMYKTDNVPGGHVIALGPGNHAAALSALRAFPGGMQMGGGITPSNAKEYLEAGASHVIVTSYVFQQGQIDRQRLDALVTAVGKRRLVLDLSCRWRGGEFWVVTDQWQRFTAVRVNRETLEELAAYCDEFLVHGVDVEGQRLGIEGALVERLGAWSPLPVTYAGGVRALEDLNQVKALGKGRVDLTIGSAFDIFGGEVSYRAVVAWQRREEKAVEEKEAHSGRAR